MKQIALDIGLAPEPTLRDFLPGRNAQAFQHVRLWAQAGVRSPVPVYLWGQHGTGKSHLLRAARQALTAQGASVGWLDPAAPVHLSYVVGWDAVFMDDVHLYGPELQHTAFNWFVNSVAPASGCAGAVLAAGAFPPADLQVREDLRTRLGWGHVFELHALGELEMRAVLRQAADARGVFLSNEVMSFVLGRFSRDLSSLMQLLDQLDRYALRTQRLITIPLIKSMLKDDDL